MWTERGRRFRGPRTGDGSWTPNCKQWVPAEWHFVHEGDGLVSIAARGVAVGAGGRVSGAARELGLDCAAGRGKPQADGRAAAAGFEFFAYTGGSTLAAAAAGAEVVHIDAAQNIVDRARQNAVLSGLAERPIRWIAEDAVKFCRREVKRGNRYDAVILDPPSYGHGPKGEPWKIDERSVAAA